MILTQSDLVAIDNLLDKKLTPVQDDIAELKNGFSILQTSVDKYLKRTEDWHVEFQVRDARCGRLETALLKRGVVTEEETALIHK